MIEHLEIKNYALIENLSIDFSEGFNVISGETGSGKSIILGALGLLMGEKADVGSIRTGCEEMLINALISIPENHEILVYLKEKGIEPEDGQIVVRRIVKQNGHGSIYVQGQIVTRQELTYIADSLIDMHGQSEHQSLLISDKQRKIVDSFSGNEKLLELCHDAYKNASETEKKLEEIKRQIDESSKQEDYLRFAFNEICNADLKENEDEELKSKITVLSQFETIYDSLSDCNEKLKQSKGLLHDASVSCNKASKCDSALSEYSERLESASIETEDIAESLRDYLSAIDYSENTINSLQERLNLIQKLKRKYGPELKDVFTFRDNAKNNLEIADNSQEVLLTMEKDLNKAREHYFEIAGKLYESRRKNALELQKRIETTLRTLGMANAKFEIGIERNEEKFSIFGTDDICFLISANPGEPLKSIKNIASGGELSRVMLSLKTVLAKADTTQTQVFDEVDAGIGGSVAKSLALSISDLSKEKQVIAITHLASIASAANSQLVVSKTVEGGRTFTHLKEVKGEERVREIARMLSGDDDKVSLEHARSLLKG